MTVDQTKNTTSERAIFCSVRNCVYNDGDKRCLAEHITVGPHFAASCADTVCASFKPKSS